MDWGLSGLSLQSHLFRPRRLWTGSPRHPWRVRSRHCRFLDLKCWAKGPQRWISFPKLLYLRSKEKIDVIMDDYKSKDSVEALSWPLNFSGFDPSLLGWDVMCQGFAIVKSVWSCQHHESTWINNHYQQPFFRCFPCDSFGQTLHLQHPGKSANYLWWLCNEKNCKAPMAAVVRSSATGKTLRDPVTLWWFHMISLVILIDLQNSTDRSQCMAGYGRNGPVAMVIATL